jgi:hypothetical protein
MPKIRDITGHTSGYLTVVSLSHTKKSKSSSSTKAWWNCVCICGKVVQITRDHIVAGMRTSCGCMKGRAKAINISGNQYGRLLALYAWETPKSGKHQWVFLCDCGQVTIKAKGDVTTGNTESCGCLSSEAALNALAVYNSIPRYGENSSNWKGGVTPISSSIRTSEEYKAWRTAVFERDLFKCQDCGIKKDIHAHHIIHFSTIRDSYNITTMEEARACALLWDITNGVTVCHDCHLERHGGAWATKKEV